MANKITTQLSAQIASEYIGGDSTCVLALRFKVSTTTILQHLTLNGVERRPKKITDPHKDQAIINDYLSGMSQEEVGLKHNVSARTVSLRLKQNELSGRHKYRLNDQQEAEIVAEYERGLSAGMIAEKRGYSNSVVDDCLRRNQVERRRNTCRSRKYTINEHWLDSIDSQEKAYFLGFFAADGYNHQDYNHINISLQERDSYILDRFSVLLGSTRPTRFVKRQTERHQNQRTFAVCSERLCDRLAELGYPQAKSLILQFPDWLTDELLPHYIRGHFDGDGCVHESKTNQHKICIVSTRSFCEKVAIALNEKCDINCQLRKHRNVTCLWVSGRQQILAFYRYVYNDQTICLERKRLKFESIQNRVMLRQQACPTV